MAALEGSEKTESQVKCDISDIFKMLNCDGLHASVTVDQAIWGDRLWLYSSWVLFMTIFFFHKVPKGRRERFQVTPRFRWPSSTPFSLHHWSRRTQQMAIAVLVTPVEAGPGPLLSTREKAGKGREAQGWCWISHPTASGLVNLELKDTGGGGGWMVGAVYWCLTNRVCLCTLQTYCLCSQLWLTVTGSTLMNMPFIL